MLDKLPRESETRSWLYVAAGVGVIYATIPVARALREVVDGSVGREAFLYLTLLMVVAGAVISFSGLRRRQLPRAAYLWLAILFTAFAILIYRLREIPEEAIHVAEYGILGLLVYRALVHRIRDYSIYVAATLIVGMIGMLDEYIQWVVPSRYYDVRDIATNFAAGFLSQLTLFAGLRPRLITGRPNARSRGRICYLAAMALLLMSVGFVNTPSRVGWYSGRFPQLQFLAEGNSDMAEYGYRFDRDTTGVFRSRFSEAQLRSLDRQRGAEVAAILDRYIRGEGYRKFLSVHSVVRDPYAHEAGVHLFRREYYLDRARENSDGQHKEHYHIAYRENEILTRFYTNAIKLSRHDWSETVVDEVSRNRSRNPSYESPVSRSLITEISEGQLIVLLALSIAGLAATGYYLGRGERASSRKEKT